jgi:hypothetical protein
VQQQDLASQIATKEFVCVPGTEHNPDRSSPRRPLELEVRVVDFLSNYSVRGILEGFTPGEVTISLSEPIAEQRSVTVHLNSFTFQGQTLYCRPKEEHFELHVSIDDGEINGLRRSPRFPVKLPAELFLPHAEPVAITIVDISSDGLGIELPVLLAKSQPIAIASGALFVFAIVRHCRQLSEGIFRGGAEMHHLFERNVELVGTTPRSTFLQRIFGKQSALTFNPRFAPPLL